MRVEADPIYVQDGAIWTSAGVSAGIDLALALIEADLGHGVALEVARYLVVFLKRPGSQAQFTAKLAGRAGATAASAIWTPGSRPISGATSGSSAWPSGWP